MRNHLQGIALLLLLVVALWGLTKLAAPTLSEAFGSDGAVMAESGDEDTVELTVNGAVLVAELTPEERERLQFNLLLAGFLTDVSQVDGVLGPTSRSAIDAAATEWGLVDASDRDVLEHAEGLYADEPFFGDS